jgi:hypothetical protein
MSQARPLLSHSTHPPPTHQCVPAAQSESEVQLVEPSVAASPTAVSAPPESVPPLSVVLPSIMALSAAPVSTTPVSAVPVSAVPVSVVPPSSPHPIATVMHSVTKPSLVFMRRA